MSDEEKELKLFMNDKTIWDIELEDRLLTIKFDDGTEVSIRAYGTEECWLNTSMSS